MEFKDLIKIKSELLKEIFKQYDVKMKHCQALELTSKMENNVNWHVSSRNIDTHLKNNKILIETIQKNNLKEFENELVQKIRLEFSNANSQVFSGINPFDQIGIYKGCLNYFYSNDYDFSYMQTIIRSLLLKLVKNRYKVVIVTEESEAQYLLRLACIKANKFKEFLKGEISSENPMVKGIVLKLKEYIKIISTKDVFQYSISSLYKTLDNNFDLLLIEDINTFSKNGNDYEYIFSKLDKISKLLEMSVNVLSTKQNNSKYFNLFLEFENKNSEFSIQVLKNRNGLSNQSYKINFDPISLKLV